jgi:hypothetical protein
MTRFASLPGEKKPKSCWMSFDHTGRSDLARKLQAIGVALQQQPRNLILFTGSEDSPGYVG